MSNKSVIFLDIDGTLTEIVSLSIRPLLQRPSDLFLSKTWTPIGTNTGITLTPGFLPKPGKAKDKTEFRRLTSLRATTGRYTTQAATQHPVAEINGARKFLNAVSDQWIAVYATDVSVRSTGDAGCLAYENP